MCVPFFWMLPRCSEQQAAPKIESRSGSDTAITVIDVSQWRQLVELGSGRTGTVALCVQPPDIINSSSRRGAQEKEATAAMCGQQHHRRIIHAVKRVPRRCIASAGAARRVLRERDALQALQGEHPGIVKLRFTSKNDQNLYFVLEPLLGGALHKHIRAAGHLEMDATRFYASEITSAVAHLHSLSFMHRDLKASNIVLCSRGHAKLVDLGCAKQLLPREPSSREDGDGGCAGDRIQSYTYCGTPHCMAPEMISRGGHTSAVDWWALGILIHEMLTGEPPFGYGGGDDLLTRISAGLPDDDDGDNNADPGKTRVEDGAAEETGQSASFLPIVRRLLEVDPEKRLGSVGGAEDVMSHDWFETVDWTKLSKHELEPPPFRRDLGELNVLEDAKEGNNSKDADPDGLFDNF